MLTSQRHVTNPTVHSLHLLLPLLLLLFVLPSGVRTSSSTARRVDKTEDYNDYRNNPPTCETIRPGSFCRDASVFYNRTAVPNPYMPFRTQRRADSYLLTHEPLVRVDCHPKLRLFLCQYTLPWCSSEARPRVVMPCRKSCEQVKRACLPLMLRFGMEWPRELSCGRLPRRGALCAHFESVEGDV